MEFSMGIFLRNGSHACEMTQSYNRMLHVCMQHKGGCDVL